MAELLKPSPPNYPPASFFGIPAELRNKIYHLALISPESSMKLVFDFREPGILAVNHQAREEAFLIFWSNNTFEKLYQNTIESSLGCLSAKHQRAIRHMRVMPFCPLLRPHRNGSSPAQVSFMWREAHQFLRTHTGAEPMRKATIYFPVVVDRMGSMKWFAEKDLERHGWFISKFYRAVVSEELCEIYKTELQQYSPGMSCR